jgi:TM2 domain-containing membrane protein YozV
MSSIPYPSAQAVFYQQYEAVRRDEIVGILLALFLGCFGIHHFYLRRTGLGILYCVFCWTGITAFLGFVECFFMPGRVREFNAIQAAGIAAALGIPMPAWGQPINVTVNVPYGNPGVQGAQYSSAMAPTAPAAQLFQGPQAAALIACPRCQRTNPQGARFCGGCGTAL